MSQTQIFVNEIDGSSACDCGCTETNSHFTLHFTHQTACDHSIQVEVFLSHADLHDARMFVDNLNGSVP